MIATMAKIRATFFLILSPSCALGLYFFFREEKVTSREELAPFLAFTAREADTAHLFVKYKSNTKLSNDRSTFKFHSTRKQL
jgi:hypothetical protein